MKNILILWLIRALVMACAIVPFSGMLQAQGEVSYGDRVRIYVHGEDGNFLYIGLDQDGSFTLVNQDLAATFMIGGGEQGSHVKPNDNMTLEPDNGRILQDVVAIEAAGSLFYEESFVFAALTALTGKDVFYMEKV